MEFVTWLDELSVGVKLFDEEHKKLIGHINKLHLGMKKGDGIASMSDVLDGLIDYTKEHFKHEEDIMLKYSYQGYEIQKEQHLNFVQKMSEFKEQFEKGKTAFTLELMIFLRDWLVNHIKGIDKKYEEFFQDKDV